MPMHETQDVTVRLSVLVGEHLFAFEAKGRATGGKYRGQDPGPGGLRGAELERSIRGTVDTNIHKVTDECLEFLADAYPLHDDPGART